MEKPFNTLGIEDIQDLNKKAIQNFGGFYSENDGNFHNRDSLEYIIEATIFPLFGKVIYKTSLEKIAAIARAIIVEHIFHDGNKRTALAVIVALLEINNFTFIPSKEDENFIVSIAENNLEVEKIAEWLKIRAKFNPF